MLKIKRFEKDAKLPTVATPGEDLGYDLYALEDTNLWPGDITKVRTGIGIQFTDGKGAIIKDRSSMASKGVFTYGGVIDAGYRGEIIVLMCFSSKCLTECYHIVKGQKIAQMIPTWVYTRDEVVDVADLETSTRGAKGFGSSGM